LAHDKSLLRLRSIVERFETGDYRDFLFSHGTFSPDALKRRYDKTAAEDARDDRQVHAVLGAVPKPGESSATVEGR